MNLHLHQAEAVLYQRSHLWITRESPSPPSWSCIIPKITSVNHSWISISTKLKLYYTKDHICESLVCRSPLDSCSDGSSLATPDQEYHNCFPFEELEETTRTSSNYVDEDYPARPEIKQSLTGWGDNCGSESSTLETDSHSFYSFSCRASLDMSFISLRYRASLTDEAQNWTVVVVVVV